MNRRVIWTCRNTCLAVAALLMLQDVHGQKKKIAQQFDYTAADISGSLATITCRNANGTVRGGAFVAQLDGKPYLITNQRFILGADRIEIKTRAGQAIRPRSIELAAARDLVRMALAEGEGFEPADDFSMGAPIAVFRGSKKSAGPLFGSITGVGADIIEVSADFKDEHSGGPALNPARQVIGIASHVSEPHSSATKKGTRFEDRTRRFCYRLDQVQWRPVNWGKFNGKFGPAYLEGKAFTEQIIDILNRWHEKPLDPLTLEMPAAKDLADWNQSHTRIVAELKNRARFDRKLQSDYSESTESLAETCRSKAATIRMIAEQRGLTDFLLREFEMQAGTLEAAADIIDKYSNHTFY